MPEDYKKVVLDYYKEKINDGSLSPRLLDPTPGSIREYCIFIYRQRSSSEDDEIVRSFFGDTKQECLSLLENSFAAKFRQLPKILKRKVENPGDKYIELIAWLIDFKPRPSISYYRSFYTDVNVRIEEAVSANQKLSEELFVSSAFVNENSNVSKNTLVNEYNKGSKESDMQEVGDNQVIDKVSTLGTTNDKIDNTLLNKLKKTVLVKNAGKVVFAIAAIAVGTYSLSFDDNQCMYWKGDYYEPIGCKVKIDEARVIALDQQKVDRLKRITRLDTINEKHLGNVWYVKIKVDSAEFYTDSGEYPLDNRKRLLPLTPYILNKYILKEIANN